MRFHPDSFKYQVSVETERDFLISTFRKMIISNFISLTKVFTSSPFNSLLLKKVNSFDIFGKYDYSHAVEGGIMDLSNEKNKKRNFFF